MTNPDRERALEKAGTLWNELFYLDSDEGIPKLTTALQRERDEAERACIRVACPACRSGEFPKVAPVGGTESHDYWHVPQPGTIMHCRGASTYELRRRRAEGESG